MASGGAQLISIEAAGALPIPSLINHLYGNTATKLTRPAGAKMLVLSCEAGSFRVRQGDYVSSGMPGSYAVGASVTNGNGALGIPAGAVMVLSAAKEITVKGYGATDTLTYYWL